jgi:surface carbohydrate biosynthesis protein
MFKKVIRKLKIISNIKILFNFPKKNDLLLYDEVHCSVLKKITNRNFNILKTRKLEIYFWIFIKQLIFFDFKFYSYCVNYIKFISPKVVVTFNDRKYKFYELKNTFKNLNFIVVQTGLHAEDFFKNIELTSSRNLRCDYFFVINKFYIKKFKKFIKSNYQLLGRFSNNFVKINKKSINKNFLFISQFDKSDNRGLNKFYEELLLKLNIYFNDSNKKIYILLRSKDPLKQKEEMRYHKDFIDCNYVFLKSSNWKKTYETINRFENIIFMNSTLGYESISRKKKVAIFSPKKIYGFKYWFGWPSPYKKKYNFFSAKNLNSSEIKRVLDNIKKCTQENWEKKYYCAIKDQLYLDKSNKKLKDIISNLLN